MRILFSITSGINILNLLNSQPESILSDKAFFIYLKPTTRFEPVNSRVDNRCLVSLTPRNTTGFYGHDVIRDRWPTNFFTASGLRSKEIMFNLFFPDGL